MGARRLESGVGWLGERFFGVYAFIHSMQLQAPPSTALAALYARCLGVSSPRGSGGFTRLLLLAPYGDRGASIFLSWDRRSGGEASAVSPLMVGSPLIEGHAGLRVLFGSGEGAACADEPNSSLRQARGPCKSAMLFILVREAGFNQMWRGGDLFSYHRTRPLNIPASTSASRGFIRSWMGRIIVVKPNNSNPSFYHRPCMRCRSCFIRERKK